MIKVHVLNGIRQSCLNKIEMSDVQEISNQELEEGEALSDEEEVMVRDEIPSAGVQDSDDDEGEDLMKASKSKKRFVS